MRSAVEATADYLREHLSAEGFEVSGSNTSQGKLWVNCPPTISSLTEILCEIYEETGASCDLDLTEDGATFTFVCQEGWQAPDRGQAPRKSTWLRWPAYVAMGVAALCVPVIMSLAQHDTNSSAPPS